MSYSKIQSYAYDEGCNTYLPIYIYEEHYLLHLVVDFIGTRPNCRAETQPMLIDLVRKSLGSPAFRQMVAIQPHEKKVWQGPWKYHVFFSLAVFFCLGFYFGKKRRQKTLLFWRLTQLTYEKTFKGLTAQRGGPRGGCGGRQPPAEKDTK